MCYTTFNMTKSASPIEKRVREALENQGLSVSELARRIGVSRVALYHLFRGNYSREMLNKISQALSIPPHVLIAPTQNITDLNEKFLSAPKWVQTQVIELLERSTQNTKRKVIVVVDDVEENVQLLKRVLRSEYDVLEFTDTKKALETIANVHPAAIISDQRMPVMNGTDLFLAASKNNTYTFRKVIVSAYSDNQAMLSAINDAHVDAFIVKPFKPEELRKKMKDLLSPAELH